MIFEKLNMPIKNMKTQLLFKSNDPYSLANDPCIAIAIDITSKTMGRWGLFIP